MNILSTKTSLWMCASALALGLTGCGLPEAPPYVQRYDLGFAPNLVQSERHLPAIALAAMDAPQLADGSRGLSYRLDYANAKQLHTYAQARWGQAPAQMVLQRLRAHLGQGGRVVLSAQQGEVPPMVNGRQVPVLRLTLEEFAQVFSTPQNSEGWVRVRATLVDPSPVGDVLLAQQVFEVRQPAGAPNASGGVQALAEGVDDIGQQMVQWLQTKLPSTP